MLVKIKTDWIEVFQTEYRRNAGEKTVLYVVGIQNCMHVTDPIVTVLDVFLLMRIPEGRVAEDFVVPLLSS